MRERSPLLRTSKRDSVKRGEMGRSVQNTLVDGTRTGQIRAPENKNSTVLEYLGQSIAKWGLVMKYRLGRGIKFVCELKS